MIEKNNIRSKVSQFLKKDVIHNHGGIITRAQKGNSKKITKKLERFRCKRNNNPWCNKRNKEKKRLKKQRKQNMKQRSRSRLLTTP